MALVELRGISKRYNIYQRPVDRLKEIVLRNRRCFHREYWALRNIDLDVEPGVTTAILGPNGSGKSTLLQIIAGVVQPTTGTVKIGGRLTAILELGAGFQMEYSGRENVLLSGMILGVTKEEMEEKMDSIAAFAEIGEFFDQPVKTYSSGMVVRLAFAAAINVDPEILLVDEALAVGDIRFQNRCVEKVDSLKAAGKTIIFVHHDPAVIRRFCDYAIILNGGQMMARGHVDEMMPIYEELIETGDIAKKVFTDPGAVQAAAVS
jgi:ABC-type polysaccharide/polyol phosphate transport system ATPase subunit